MCGVRMSAKVEMWAAQKRRILRSGDSTWKFVRGDLHAHKLFPAAAEKL